MATAWFWFSLICTVAFLGRLVLRAAPIPFFDHNSATLMCKDKRAQEKVALALATAIGQPGAELNTPTLDRLLFRDGTSVDVLKIRPRFKPTYEIVALKSIVLGFLSMDRPGRVAQEISEVLEFFNFKTEVILSPDNDIPLGDVVLVLSEAFQTDETHGFGILIRKHALRMSGGPRPQRFPGFDS